jgi:hypothetical protein
MKINLQERGNALLVTVLFFVVVTSAIIVNQTSPVSKKIKGTNQISTSRSTIAGVESGVEDAVYRLKNNLNTPAIINLNNSWATVTTTTTTGSTTKNINSLSSLKNIYKIFNISVNEVPGIGFNYGIEAGLGGVELTGSSGINGNIYSNGPVRGSSSSFITGSAISANAPAMTADQENSSPIIPTTNINIGQANASQDTMQSFTVSSSSPINKVSLYIRKVSTPANATVHIATDNGSGMPSNNYIASGTLLASSVTTSYNWVDVSLNYNPSLTPGVTYWLVINAATNGTRYYQVGANTGGYALGRRVYGQYSTIFTNDLVNDVYFKIFLGGQTGLIEGSSGSIWNRMNIGTGGTGNAQAYTIRYTNTTGTNYCQVGVGNNTVCNTTLPVPVYKSPAITTGNISDWKNEATAGGTYTGNYSIGGSSTVYLGPQKIVGDLTVNGSGILYVTGTLYVTGNISISGAGQVRLAPAYGANSGAIIADGRITIAGSSPVTGSGTTGSYILMITNSNCPTSSSCSSLNAIDISGAAGAVVLYAPNGFVNFSGSASAKSATGYKVILSGATTISYESGLANLLFTSGPSGTFEITKWRESY